MLFGNFKEDSIKQSVYYEFDEHGRTTDTRSRDRVLNFKKGNIIQLQEDFVIGDASFYKEYNGGFRHENLVLPKGFSMRIESITGYYNLRVVFNPLLRYNKKIDTDLKCKKFRSNFEFLHGMKFAVFQDNDAFMRKRKIDTLLST